jgi:acetyltransferase-like isoleucine patch superfamily enzyme
VGTHSVLSAGSVAGSNLRAWTIYRGNPAQPVRQRILREADPAAPEVAPKKA